MPKSFPSRPTTDYAKEGLFNILENEMYLEDLSILDLCAGTGSISYEFLSRDAGTVTAVDSNHNVIKHLKKVAKDYDCEKDINIIKSDILKFVEQTGAKFDLIFADPPFSYDKYHELIKLIFERDLLNEGGTFVLEHGRENSFEEVTHFDYFRKYGNVYFSFFRK